MHVPKLVPGCGLPLLHFVHCSDLRILEVTKKIGLFLFSSSHVAYLCDTVLSHLLERSHAVFHRVSCVRFNWQKRFFNIGSISTIKKFIFSIIDLSTSDYFKTYYVATHVRMHAYLVGIIAGAVLYDYKDAKWQFSKVYIFSIIIFDTEHVYLKIKEW